MSNPQRMKIMKKLLYSACALFGIFAVSCSKTQEMEAPVTPEKTGEKVTYTIHAVYDESDGVRTTYAGNRTFAWQEGDVINVRCIDANDEYWGWREFVAQSSGAETDFVAELEDGWHPYDCAVYQSYKGVYSEVYNDSNVLVTLPISYHLDGYGLDDSGESTTPYYNSVSVPAENPLSVVPLVGLPQDDGSLKFQTAVGVLKVNLTDVDPSATHIRIANSDGYMGNYMMMKDGEFRMNEPFEEEGQLYTVSFLEYYFSPVSDGKVSFYIPVPVGTIGTGSAFSVLDANNQVLFSQTVKKDIVIGRNKVVELATLSTKAEWETLGTGKFIDAYLWEDLGGSIDTYVDVEIQKSKNQSGYYKIVNPYGAAAQAFHYTAPHTVRGPQDLVFRVLSAGESLNGVKATVADHVYFDEAYTGIDAADDYLDDENTEDDLEYTINHPSDFSNFSRTEYDWGRSLVAKYGADGNPANVLLAPIYYWGGGYWTGNNPLHQTNSLIQIVFPGVTSTVDLESGVSYLEIADDTPAQAVALASVSLGSDVASAKVVIATSLDAAKAAISANQNVTEVTGSGEIEVLFPANAPSGDYRVYAYTQAKDGFTEAANQYLVSDVFKYFNAEDDLGFTIEDVIGDFSNNTFVNYFNSGSGWGWNYNQTFFVRIEESDEESLGNVMITLLGEFQGQYYIGPNTDYVTNVYGTFNPRTGELVFAGDQPMYDWSDEETPGEGPYIAISADMSGSDIRWTVKEPGKIIFSGQIYLRSYDPSTGNLSGYYQVFNGYPTREYELVRETSEETSEAPALIAKPKGKMEKATMYGAVPFLR